MNYDVIQKMAPSSSQPEKYYRDLTFLSYVIVKVAELRKEKKISVTRLVKVAANFIQDWQDILHRSTDYQINIRNKPHLYGMVPFVPYLPEKPCIMDLGPSAKEVDLWKIQEESGKKYVEILTDSSQIRKTLKTEDYGFKNIQISEADIISEIYSELNTEELNILASHRSLNNSKSCMRHLFRKWETNYQEIIQIIKVDTIFDKEQLKLKLLKLIACCIQIEIKTEYALHKIGDLCDKLKLISKKFESSTIANTIVLSLIEQIELKSKLTKGEMVTLEEQYKTNREILYFITRLFIKYFQLEFGQLFTVEDKNLKIINDMNTLLGREPIFECEIKDVKIDSSIKSDQLLQLIEETHYQAKIRAESLLRKFKEKELLPNEERIDIEINDGRDI